jgi:hypothetical protein
LRTDVAVLAACGLEDVQPDSPQAHFVWPAPLAQFRRRLDAALREAWLAMQAAAAMDEGLLSPAPLLVDTFPAAQGSQRVSDASPLYNAQTQSSSASRAARRKAARKRRRYNRKPTRSTRTSKRSCVAWAVNAGGRAKCL